MFYTEWFDSHYSVTRSLHVITNVIFYKILISQLIDNIKMAIWGGTTEAAVKGNIKNLYSIRRKRAKKYSQPRVTDEDMTVKIVMEKLSPTTVMFL